MANKEWIPISQSEPIEGEVYEVKYTSKNGDGKTTGVYKGGGISVHSSFLMSNPDAEITHAQKLN